MARSRNWKQLYFNYQKQYNKVVAKSPVSMEEFLLPEEFKAQYIAMFNDRMADVKAGKRVAATNITRDIVARQQNFAYSVKQAREIAKVIKDLNIQNVKYKEIRTGEADLEFFWDAVKAQQSHYRDLGFSPREIKDFIAQEFFGSV